MVTTASGVWGARVVTLLVWALVAGSATAWWLKLSVKAPPAPAVAVALAPPPPADPAALARVLGAQAVALLPNAPPPVAGSRLALVGVVANRSRSGAALIAVDGKPPKPFRVGAKVEEGLVLQSVAPRRAVLGPSASGPASITLELPVQRP
jgi:general secretion pathway protein C